jgi:hypothetical protein
MLKHLMTSEKTVYCWFHCIAVFGGFCIHSFLKVNCTRLVSLYYIIINDTSIFSQFDLKQLINNPLSCRDCIGDCVLTGDNRWAGTFGVNLDFVARSHCSVEFIPTEDMQVLPRSNGLSVKCYVPSLHYNKVKLQGAVWCVHSILFLKSFENCYRSWTLNATFKGKIYWWENTI